MTVLKSCIIVGIALIVCGLIRLRSLQRQGEDVGPEPLPPLAEAYVISEKEQFVTRDVWFSNDPYRNQWIIDEYVNNQSNVLFVVMRSSGPIEVRRHPENHQ